jgi:type III secretion protein V
VSADLGPRQAVVAVFEVPARVVEVPEQDDGATAIADAALEVLRGRASDFIGLAETQALLDELEQVTPAVVRNVVPKPVPVALLADVLRRLVEERVSVRDLRAILEALATAAATEKDALALSEHVRAQLRRAITFHLTGGTAALDVYLLEPAIEDAIRHAVTRTSGGAFLALSPAATRDVIAAIRRAIEAAAPSRGAPRVILTQPDIRRFVRKLVDVDFAETRVVSFAELMPEVTLRPIAKATLVAP